MTLFFCHSELAKEAKLPNTSTLYKPLLGLYNNVGSNTPLYRFGFHFYPVRPRAFLFVRQVGAMATPNYYLMLFPRYKDTPPIIRWLIAFFIFFWGYGIMAGFIESWLTESINKSLLFDGVYFDSSFIITLILVFIIVLHVVYFLLSIFPNRILVSKIQIWLAFLSMLIYTVNHTAFSTPRQLAATILLFFAGVSGIISINRFKKVDSNLNLY